MRYEVSLKQTEYNKEETNALILSLVRYGYAVYLSDEDDICFTVMEDEIEEIKEK